MSSASRSASSPASGSWSRTPSSSGARGRRSSPGRRAASCSLDSASRACSAAVRRVSAKPEPGLLGRQRGVLARLRVDRLDLARGRTAAGRPPGPARGRSPRPRRARARWPRAGRGASAYARQQRRRRSAPPNRSSASRCAAGLQQPVLVGLAVHGDQRLGDAGQRGDRHRGAADEGPGAALGGDVAGQHDPVVLDLAPGLLDRAGEPGAGRRRGRRPRPARSGRRCAPRRCRRGRRAAARAR